MMDYATKPQIFVIRVVPICEPFSLVSEEIKAPILASSSNFTPAIWAILPDFWIISIISVPEELTASPTTEAIEPTRSTDVEKKVFFDEWHKSYYIESLNASLKRNSTATIVAATVLQKRIDLIKPR